MDSNAHLKPNNWSSHIHFQLHLHRGAVLLPAATAQPHLRSPCTVNRQRSNSHKRRRARTHPSMDPCSSPALERNWLDLGDGLTGQISDCVLANDVADYIRFRAVCDSWRQCSAAPPADDTLARRFHPRRWIMLREPPAAPTRRRFLNSSTGECVQVDIPKLRDHEVLAPTAEGLLVLLHARKHVRLLNPMTGQLLQLPALTTLLPAMYHHRLSVHNTHFGTDFAAWGSGVADDGSTFLLCFYRLRMLGVAKLGDQSWTLLKFRDPLRTAPLMFAGRFYCVTVDCVMVLEMSPPRLEVAARRHMRVSVEMDSTHLVDNGGQLMLVHRRFSQLGSKCGRSYDLYRVDLDTRSLLPVNSLGRGRAMFMGMYCSISVPVEVFPFGSITSDTIYLSFDVDEREDTEAYHLVDTSITPAASYNLDGLVLQPHTLVDCLALCITSNIVGFQED
ncbi:hypothetical protein ACQ4PT_047122 [Festuca glaucescens]